jgi:diguanylate cyclase (GGDEF)-like protein/PAS domain S-box-containing protein
MHSKPKSLIERLTDVEGTDAEKVRRGRLISILISITFFFNLVLLLANLFAWKFLGSENDRGFFLLGSFGLVYLAGLWLLNRRGMTGLSAYLLLATYFVRIGLIQDPQRFINVFWAYAFPILISSFVLKPWASFPSAGISITLYLLIAGWVGYREPVDLTLFKIIGLTALASIPYITASHLNWAIATIDRSEAKYHNLFNDLPIGLYRTSPDGRILDVNSAFLRMFGFPDSQAVDRITAADLYADPSSRDQHLDIVEKTHTTEMQMRRQDGSTIWVSDHVSPVHGRDGKVQYYEGSLVDITERRRAVDQLQQLATRDPLTGIANRRFFFAQAEEIFQRSIQPPFELAVLMIDLDHFKQINDTYGHLAGDAILRESSSRFQSGLRTCDLLGRYGGEEFAVLLHRTDRDQTVQIAARLHAAIGDRPYHYQGESIRVTVSIGIAFLDPSVTSLEVLLGRADQALYKAKKSGRNRSAIWEPEGVFSP